jgi:anti-sigma regulatory factor (Ser/Thr protein kinase)
MKDGASSAQTAIKNCIWLNLDGSEFSRSILTHLRTRFSCDVVTGRTLPKGSTVAILIADDSSVSSIDDAQSSAAPQMQTILVTSKRDNAHLADFVVSKNVGFDSFKSVFAAASSYRSEVLELRLEIARRTSAICTIRSGRFEFQTLDQARDLAIMLALTCPDPDGAAIGLIELMINAVEHGNLEIHYALKQELLAHDGWRDEVLRRLSLPEYSDRAASIEVKRTDRMISMRIEDAGGGFDHAKFEADARTNTGYHGRGITIARGIAFDNLTYLDRGNIVECTIILPQDADEASCASAGRG